ncbi:protein phosphatase 1 regulatory subunit 36 [Hyla sarda]|uniref:protein phosphatase 1 regulatory subunit 36 n=1 Tax=Hyla sarda TaxID=327740 RepID=UPI0024C2E4C7|nr:protein phosphatase 1 regulatory subunit 36 [Hyla sarda]
MEQITKPSPGKWYWKEETKTLEFTRRSDSSYRWASGAKSLERSSTDRITKSPKQKKRLQHEFVALEDVKRVALNLIEEQERLCLTFGFSNIFRSQQLDDFLMALINYLYWFLVKQSRGKQPKTLLPRPKVLEEEEMAALDKTIEAAMKHLAFKYSILVLGEGLGKQHHLACGRSRASATLRDRRFFECLYSYCIQVVWVVFRRKKLEEIQKEIGRILRTNNFNPALRVKDAMPSRNLSGSKKKATYADDRKANNKRSPIKKIITHCSPVLSSLIPTPKERSQYLFHQHELHPKGTEYLDMEELLDYNIPTCIGIIGEPMKQFHFYDLTPYGVDEEEEPDPDKQNSFSSLDFQGFSGYHSPVRPATGRQSQVISRATTEATYSDMY